MHCVSRSELVHGQSSFKNVEESRKRDLSKGHPKRTDDAWYDFEKVLLVSLLRV